VGKAPVSHDGHERHGVMEESFRRFVSFVFFVRGIKVGTQ